MLVTQIAELVNQSIREQVGETDLLNEDLNNVVDTGRAIEDAMGVDNFVRALADTVGRYIFVNRKYEGGAPNLMIDGWEYGAIMEKISAEIPDAEVNESWELDDRASYDPNIFYRPTVSVTYFNKRTTFEIPISYTREQVKSAFQSAAQLGAFIDLILTQVENGFTIAIDGLSRATVNNMIAETIHDDYASASLSSKSGIKAVNLLYLYNQTIDSPLDADEAMNDPGFLRFASLTIRKYVTRLKTASKLFNISGKLRFTPVSSMHLVMLEDFASAADAYLYSDTFHEEYVKMPSAERVAYWQGSGDDYGFDGVSAINVTSSEGNTVNTDGILAVMFDKNAAAIANPMRKVNTYFNPKADFYTNFNKYIAMQYNDFAENFVVFFIA